MSTEVSNAFNSFSRKKLLDLLLSKTPSLVAFMSMIYDWSAPLLFVRLRTGKSEPHILFSQEVTQQGDPEGTFFFTFCLQAHVRQISDECDLLLNRWCDNDRNLIGPISAVQKALKILRTRGLTYQFHLNPSKKTAYWPTITMDGIANLQVPVTLRVFQENSLKILGGPIDAEGNMRSHLMSRTNIA